MVHDHKKAFIRLFNETARYENRFTVFRDFISMSAISIHNAMFMSDKLEQEYMQIVKKYKKDDAIRMSHLLGEVIMGLEAYRCDFLGSLFMELELGSNGLAQFFTPYEVSRMMALMVHGDAIEALADKPFITLSEPCCGAGSMVIAFAEAMLDKGLNPQQQLWVSCIDIDPVAAMMCYLHLSLLHIPAEIVIGNALSLEYTRVMRTPAHYLGFWDSKLRRRWSGDDAQDVKADEETPIVSPQSVVTPSTGQMSLFDIVT